MEVSNSVGDLAKRLQMVVIRSQHPESGDRISWDIARDIMEAASILLSLEKQEMKGRCCCGEKLERL